MIEFARTLMTFPRYLVLIIICTTVFLKPTSIHAATLKIAVASNFKDTFKVIAQRFEEKTGHSLLVSAGSTGKHYMQIANGAPFDLFLAADVERAELAEQNGFGVQGSRQTYAFGKLALLSNVQQVIRSDQDALSILAGEEFRYLAIANPRHAPYGKAAVEVLSSQGLWPKLKARLVQGENIAQTFQFVYSGNAQLGFVAYSQIVQMSDPALASVWMVPKNLYAPIEQQLLLLKESKAGRELIEFLVSATALEIIRQYGYDTPDVK